jgi:hypothetical protein
VGRGLRAVGAELAEQVLVQGLVGWGTNSNGAGDRFLADMSFCSPELRGYLSAESRKFRYLSFGRAEPGIERSDRPRNFRDSAGQHLRLIHKSRDQMQLRAESNLLLGDDGPPGCMPAMPMVTCSRQFIRTRRLRKQGEVRTSQRRVCMAVSASSLGPQDAVRHSLHLDRDRHDQAK